MELKFKKKKRFKRWVGISIVLRYSAVRPCLFGSHAFRLLTLHAPLLSLLRRRKRNEMYRVGRTGRGLFFFFYRDDSTLEIRSTLFYFRRISYGPKRIHFTWNGSSRIGEGQGFLNCPCQSACRTKRCARYKGNK